MNTLSITEKVQPQVGAIVELNSSVAGVQEQHDRFVVREQLGPGIVIDTGDEGRLHVHWVKPDLDTWVESQDLDVVGACAHLIAIYRTHPNGERTLQRCKIVSGRNLSHNWTVELIPENVIRTVRSDGLAWTFDWHPWFKRAEPHSTILHDALGEDDHAEALTVAELAPE